MEELYAFSKNGKQVAAEKVPEMIYLMTKKDWTLNMLERRPNLDGIAFIINWDTHEITMVRHAD